MDSLLPRKSWNEFLFKPENKSEKFRVKTIRLKKQLSQGIVFPLNILPLPIKEHFQTNTNDADWKEGEDVTQILNITKYEPYIPAKLQGLIKGNFPSWLYKTDEIRIQSIPKFIERHKGKKFFITEKLDGSSMTAYLKDGEFGVCSRNLELKDDDNNAFWRAARSFELKERLQVLNKNIALQMELAGPKIQGNPYNLSDYKIYLFDVYDIDLPFLKILTGEDF